MRACRVVLLALAVGAGCGSGAARSDGGGAAGHGGDGGSGGYDAASDASSDHPRGLDAAPGSLSCGGTVSGTGTTPKGTFVASDIYVNATLTCWSVNVTISDTTAAEHITFSLNPSADAGAASLLGMHTVTAALSPIQGGSLSVTTVMVNITAAGDPFGGTSTSPMPSGMLSGTFSLDSNGFSLDGSFSSPYCAAMACSH